MSGPVVVHVDDAIEGAVYIGRRMNRRGLKGSPLANPFAIGQKMSRSEAIAKYEVHLTARVVAGDEAVLTALAEARGKPLACWCRHQGQAVTPETSCHGDVIAMVLADYSDEQLRQLAVRL